jgi:MFS family permease
MGFYQAVYAIGMLAGPMLSGFLADARGMASVFYLSAGLCLVIAALAFLPAFRRGREKITD